MKTPIGSRLTAGSMPRTGQPFGPGGSARAVGISFIGQDDYSPDGLRSSVDLMTVSETDIAALAASHDIIAIGMEADALRREKHGNRTTFVRVARLDAAPGAALDWPV